MTIFDLFGKRNQTGRMITQIKDENEKLKSRISTLKDSSTLGVFNPDFPFRNTPIELIDVDSIHSFCVSGNVILLNSGFEQHTIYIDSDEKILKILKAIMKDVPFSLVDWNSLIISLEGTQLEVDLQEMVYMNSLKRNILETKIDHKLMLANYSSEGY